MKSFETLEYRVEDGVALVTLDRPASRNAYNAQMRVELIAALDQTDADDAVRAVVLTGSGEHFCVGADLSQGAAAFDPSRPGAVEHRVIEAGIARDGAGLLALRIFASLKPIIGAINGTAAGAGASICLPLDMRLATGATRFGFVFGRRGMTPEGASSWFLPRLVGIPTALEWCYSGRLIGATEAQQAGLVRSIHAPDALVPEALALARSFATQSAPVSMALIRQMIWRMAGASHPMEAHQADSRAIRARAQAEDVKEGVAAFLEKRSPIFPDQVSAGLPDIFPFWEEPAFR